MAPVYVLLLLLVLGAPDRFAAYPRSSEYNKQHIRFHFYNKGNADTVTGTQLMSDFDKQNILDAGYNPKAPLKIVIHGYANSIASDSVQNIKNAYFDPDAGLSDTNVIALDWSDLNPYFVYPWCVWNLRGAAERLVEFLDFMVDAELLSLGRLHILGHSLGAHLAGIAGELLAGRGRIPRITGLDPAAPLIDFKADDGRLSLNDADLVDIIHTNAGLLAEKVTTGHIDFYPNGGDWQPGCTFDLLGMCSHGRAFDLYAESITKPAAFTAWLCPNATAALASQCDPNDVTATMGEFIRFQKQGPYYLRTNSESPFLL